jgi:hypothetical protein
MAVYFGQSQIMGEVSLLGTNQFNLMFYCRPSLTLHQPNFSRLPSLQFCLFVLMLLTLLSNLHTPGFAGPTALVM